MADNQNVDNGTLGTLPVRSIDKAGVLTQVVTLDLGGAGAEDLPSGVLPVSAASLPLPSGAATSAIQTTQQTALDSINTKIDALTTPTDTQPISAASLPLPTGAATEATLANLAAEDFATQTTLADLNTKVTACNTGAVTISAALPAGANVIGALTANQSVNVAQMNGVTVSMGNGASGTGVQRVTLANDSTGIVALTTSTASIGKLAANSGIDIGDVDVLSVIAGTGATNLGKAEDAAHTTGDTGVAILSRRIDTAATSSDTSGDYSTVNQSAEGALWATLTPTTTSGLSVGNFNNGDTYTALTNTAQVVKASAGLVYGYYFYNPNSSVAYVLLYNIAAASVTVGTSTATMVFAVPAGAAANLMMPYGITFSTAIAIAAATTGGGNTAPATALDAMIWYK